MAAIGALQGLYRDTILDHSSHPRNFGAIEAPDLRATGHNPLCGDKVTIYLKLGADGRIEAASFEGSGCAISTASASLLTEQVRGLDRTRAIAMSAELNDLVSGACESSVAGEISALAGVRGYPSRIRCAMLPWRTLEAAFNDDPRTVSTEG
jgi:nitrogen fixation NifU-like protein